MKWYICSFSFYQVKICQGLPPFVQTPVWIWECIYYSFLHKFIYMIVQRAYGMLFEHYFRRCGYTILYVTIPCCPHTIILLQYFILRGDLHSYFLKNNYFILEEIFRRVQLPSYKFLRSVLRRNHFFLLLMYTFYQVNSSMR